MERLKLSKREVVERLNNGTEIRGCGGLWNNPLTHNKVLKTEQEINEFFSFYSMTEVKQYEGNNALYLHGYSDCDMF